MNKKQDDRISSNTKRFINSFFNQFIFGKVKTISIRNCKNYSFDSFWNDIHTYGRSWVTWETRKSYHVDPRIAMISNNYFKKCHGNGVDDNRVEVFCFDGSMLNFGKQVKEKSDPADNGIIGLITKCRPFAP